MGTVLSQTPEQVSESASQQRGQIAEGARPALELPSNNAGHDGMSGSGGGRQGNSNGSGSGSGSNGAPISQQFNDAVHGADTYRDLGIDLRSPASHKDSPRFHASGGGHIHGQTHRSEAGPNAIMLHNKFDHIAEVFEARDKWLGAHYGNMLAADLPEGGVYGGRDKTDQGQHVSVESRGKEVVFAYKKVDGKFRELSGYPLEDSERKGR